MPLPTSSSPSPLAYPRSSSFNQLSFYFSHPPNFHQAITDTASESESGVTQARRRVMGYGLNYLGDQNIDEENIQLILEETGITYSQVYFDEGSIM